MNKVIRNEVAALMHNKHMSYEDVLQETCEGLPSALGDAIEEMAVCRGHEKFSGACDICIDNFNSVFNEQIHLAYGSVIGENAGIGS